MRGGHEMERGGNGDSTRERMDGQSETAGSVRTDPHVSVIDNKKIHNNRQCMHQELKTIIGL